MELVKNSLALILRWILTAMVLAMTLLILGQVFWRYVLEAPFVWSEELSLLLMTWITFLGAALLLMRNEHLGIEVFIEKMPPLAAKASLLLGRALVLLFCICLVYGAWILMEKTRNSITPGLQISVAWQYGGAFVGGILMALVALEQFVRGLLNLDESETGQ
ncbi:MAG: TRAP transporter small permease [Roseovarius sp.]